MSTTDNLPAVPSPGAEPARWAEMASDMFTLAKGLAGSQIVPRAFQNRPDDITAVWLMGAELGLPPMAALLNIHMIEGRASMSANAMRGLAQSKGVRFEVVSASDTRVQMRAKAPGDERWTDSDWPIERAQKMGLTNKSNWQKMPQSMLAARATSELCRLVASHVLMGMYHSTEELSDMAGSVSVGDLQWAADTEQVAEAQQQDRPRRVRRAPIRAQVPEPPLEPEPEDRSKSIDLEESGHNGQQEEPAGRVIGQAEQAPAIEAPPAGDDRIADRTRTAIMAGFNESNVKDRIERMERVSEVVGREVHSVNQLTDAEGRRVVRWLTERRQRQGPA